MTITANRLIGYTVNYTVHIYDIAFIPSNIYILTHWRSILLKNAIKGLFITGTGTDVGKTIVTSALLHALYQKKNPVLAVKPIQTGMTCDVVDQEGDAFLYNSAIKNADYNINSESYLKPKTLHTFSLPASPHLASAEEHCTLHIGALKKEIVELYHTTKHTGNDVPLLIEGAGGVLVPINEQDSTLDFMQALGLPVVIVMKNKLGALNHALLTIESIKQRGLEILAVVATESKARDKKNSVLLDDNINYLRNVAKVTVFEVPYIAEIADTTSIAKEAWNRASHVLENLANVCIEKWNMHNSIKDDTVAQMLLDWDTNHLWHPYTSSTNPLPVYEVTRTHGTRIYIKDKATNFAERALIDGMASWWCAIHGYGNQALVDAAVQQSKSMTHVMFGGLTHEPAISAAQTLLSLLPTELTRLFWADSGSVSVEVALKMALQYQKGKGHQSRHRILTPLGGYHGDTMGAMSVCDPVNGMHGLFRGAVAEQLFISRPNCRFDEPFDASCTHELEQAFAEHGHTLAAVILEPIVQGAGGMWFYHPEYLRRVRELCTKHQVLLIVDEIATGFGRTGKMFACEWAGITPDIMCVGKGLTGGFMSLAATICTDDVATHICADDNVFMHGPTFMGNPLGCAVAKASLDVLLQSDWQANIVRIERQLKEGLSPCAEMDDVADVRVLGAIGVVEMKNPVNMQSLQAFFVEQGVWIRPFGRLIYVMPPYISTNDDVDALCNAIMNALTEKAYR